MQVSKWGNSMAIRLPAALVEELNLKPGDEIRVHVAGRSDFAIEREMTRDEAIEKMRASRKPLPAGFTFDRQDAHAR
ncbi:MAG TPA: AbrB/MazE/SpoVT family DNA-binding domain-containing protein [Bryobacteraceae bacterium]|nr:AbrB/MazE/SpoVT family DNA-binding domain-containing protein [Bryobacteraceae bacterium]